MRLGSRHSCHGSMQSCRTDQTLQQETKYTFLLLLFMCHQVFHLRPVCRLTTKLVSTPRGGDFQTQNDKLTTLNCDSSSEYLPILILSPNTSPGRGILSCCYKQQLTNQPRVLVLCLKCKTEELAFRKVAAPALSWWDNKYFLLLQRLFRVFSFICTNIYFKSVTPLQFSVLKIEDLKGSSLDTAFDSFQ